MKLAEALKKSYKYRINMCMESILRHAPEEDATGLLAMAHYYFGKTEDKARAEQVIFRTANWFNDCPYYSGGKKRPLRGECDFAAMRLARVLMTGTEGMSAKTTDMIEEFFTQNEFESMYKSENHMLLFHTARLFAARVYKNKVFKAYGKKGAELAAEDEEFLIDYLTFRGGHSWAEFDSVGYLAEDMMGLFLLFDFAGGKLGKLAGMSLDQILLDMIADCMGPMYCGAHGRIYERHALDYATGSMFHVFGLYFGSPYLEEECMGDEVNINFVEYAMTKYIPSDYVYAAVVEKPQEYENFEAKNLHSISLTPPQQRLPQEEGHISKYTYITPQYAIGGVCFQDEYKNPDAAWYAHHQQHEWELSFANDTEAKVFTHHPGSHGTEGKEHGYWTGDLECCCGTFYTNKNISLAMYDIPENEEAEINANVLFRLYEVREDGNYLFLRHDKAYASLYFSEGYYHKTDGNYPERELRSKGRKHAVVCVAGTKAEYGSLDNFVNAIKAQPVIFDKEKMSVEYGGIYMDKKVRRIGARQVKFPFALYDNPFMKSELGSGVIKVYTSLGETTLDFNRAEITTR